jgi:hypothetical protein
MNPSTSTLQTHDLLLRILCNRFWCNYSIKQWLYFIWIWSHIWSVPRVSSRLPVQHYGRASYKETPAKIKVFRNAKMIGDYYFWSFLSYQVLPQLTLNHFAWNDTVRFVLVPIVKRAPQPRRDQGDFYQKAFIAPQSVSQFYFNSCLYSLHHSSPVKRASYTFIRDVQRS